MKQMEKVLYKSQRPIRPMKEPGLVEKRHLKVVKVVKELRPLRTMRKIRWVLLKTRPPSNNKNKNILETMADQLANHQPNTTSHPISSSSHQMHNSRAKTPTLVLLPLSSLRMESWLTSCKVNTSTPRCLKHSTSTAQELSIEKTWTLQPRLWAGSHSSVSNWLYIPLLYV